MAKKSYWDETYYPQPTEQELRRNAAETAHKASKKGKLLNPVVLSGRKIAKSWWGQAWCENLERYADFDTLLIANRVESMLSNADKPSSRIIQGAALEDLFGIL